MIKKFIDKLLGKAGRAATAAVAVAPAAASAVAGVRVEVPKSAHRLDPKLLDERAVKVVTTLVAGGYEAYIVGGAVRDLLVGLRPKDFDVATNATPEQVKGLFRRAFIIGRRFRIVHVVFGRGRQERGLSEVIEVSTFRAMVDAAASPTVAGNEKTSRAELDRRHTNTSRVVDTEGRVLRDNVWGSQKDDAARRDFTINAMYYDPVREIVVDYHGGIADVGARLLRMIGDPATRYREDPVRIIRVVRFAAKLGFEIEAATRAPIREMAGLLDNVPPSRTFDEMIKLLQTGHALASIAELRKQGLHRGVFPVLDVALDEAERDGKAAGGRQGFVELALADTDRRVGEDKPVAPSFMLACMLWHEVQGRWSTLKNAGEPPFGALQQAVDTVFDARIGDISGRGKLAADMREIWLMQPRFERRQGNAVVTLLEQPRFRAGFDFLRLRAQAGEIDAELATWWEAISTADEAGREALIEAMRGRDAAPRRARNAPHAAARRGADTPMPAADADADDSGGTADREAADADDAAAAEAGTGDVAAVRKRRRRRRKPAAGGADAGEDAGSVAGSPRPPEPVA
jgi:poly(A) polymerase